MAGQRTQAARVGKTSRRSYTMRARAVAVDATRQAIFDAAYERFVRDPYDEVTLQQIADDAGVTVQTVLRHFRSKEDLVVAGATQWSARERVLRMVPPGDVVKAVRVLAARYEAIGPVTSHLRALAPAVPAVADLLQAAQRAHHEWLGAVFGSYLSHHPATRARQLAQLFSATEIASWMAWRTTLGLSRAAATRCLGEHLQTLVEAWKR